MEEKIKVAFAKKGRMKYISHLDLMRLFGRALRRADLPFALTQGFSKHPKYSIKRALKLGLESENEEAEFAMREDVAPEEFRRRLQEALPEGIEIVGARLSARGFQRLAARRAAEEAAGRPPCLSENKLIVL